MHVSNIRKTVVIYYKLLFSKVSPTKTAVGDENWGGRYITNQTPAKLIPQTTRRIRCS